MKLAQNTNSNDNLYQVDDSGVSNTEEVVVNNSSDNGSGIGDFFNGFDGGFLPFDIASVVDGFHYFTLAFLIFNAIVLYIDYIVWYFYISGLDLWMESTDRGKNQFFKIVKMYKGYLPLLLLWLVFKTVTIPALGELLGLLLIIGFIIKNVRDVRFFPIIGILRGDSEYSGIFENDNELIGQTLKHFRKRFEFLKFLGGSSKSGGAGKGVGEIAAGTTAGLGSLIPEFFRRLFGVKSGE